MRTLVQNYSSEASTEAMYFNQALLEVGLESHLWRNGESAFDIFDNTKPDLFITHFGLLSKDIVKRLTGSDIKVAINMTGANEDILKQLQNLPINLALAFQNDKTSLHLPVISPCADVFMSRRLTDAPDYKIEALFVVEGPEDFKSFEPMMGASETYHVITPSSNLKEFKGVDAHLPLMALSSIYSKYNSVVTNRASQAMYDAAYYNGESGICTGDPESFIKLKKEVVCSGHTPYNRVRQLLQNIGEIDLSERFNEKIGEQ